MKTKTNPDFYIAKKNKHEKIDEKHGVEREYCLDNSLRGKLENVFLDTQDERILNLWDDNDETKKINVELDKESERERKKTMKQYQSDIKNGKILEWNPRNFTPIKHFDPYSLDNSGKLKNGVFKEKSDVFQDVTPESVLVVIKDVIEEINSRFENKIDFIQICKNVFGNKFSIKDGQIDLGTKFIEPSQDYAKVRDAIAEERLKHDEPENILIDRNSGKKQLASKFVQIDNENSNKEIYVAKTDILYDMKNCSHVEESEFVETNKKTKDYMDKYKKSISPKDAVKIANKKVKRDKKQLKNSKIIFDAKAKRFRKNGKFIVFNPTVEKELFQISKKRTGV